MHDRLRRALRVEGSGLMPLHGDPHRHEQPTVMAMTAESDTAVGRRCLEPRPASAPHRLSQRAAVTGRCFRRNSRTCFTAWGIRSLGSFQG